MIKGGFQYIDLTGYTFTSETGETVPGIYELIEGTTKPVILTGLNLGGNEYRDQVCQIVTDSGAFKGFIGQSVTFTVSAADAVVFYC